MNTMLQNRLLLFFMLSGTLALAQKETSQTLGAENIDAIVLSADEIYRISISTAAVDEIRITTRSDGEYYNRISLDSEIKGETLYLTSRFREILQSGYDKLSAHKVFAMEVFLEIPEGLSVDISSNLASVHASGEYNKLLIQLKSGSCYLTGISADGIVNTFNGNIELEAKDAQVTANSRHGELKFSGKNSGAHKIALSSINGDIRVVHTK